MLEREPEWDEKWQPSQPITVDLLRKAVEKNSASNQNRKSIRSVNKKKVHSISRVFNFYENTVDVFGNEDDQSAANENKAAMSRLTRLPWEENVMDGDFHDRRNICMLQVMSCGISRPKNPGNILWTDYFSRLN